MPDLDSLIRITSRVVVGDAPRLNFGRGLLVTLNSALSAAGSGKARLFNDLDAVSAALGSTSEATVAARAWFSADPAPQGLYIGRWAEAVVETSLRGGTPGSPSSGALDASNATFAVNGQTVSVDLDSADTHTAIAAAVQTAIVALGGGFAAATFVFDTDAYLLTLAGSNPITGGAFSDTADATDTDIAAALGMAVGSSGRVYIEGSNAETIDSAIAAMFGAASGSEPVIVILAADVPDTVRLTVAAHAETRGYLYVMLETSETALTAGDTTTTAAQVFALQYANTAAVYSTPGQKPDAALAAAMSAQNFSLPASIISPVPIPLPGVVATAITSEQRDELTRKRTSVYTDIGGLPSFFGGWTSRNGNWLDARYFLSWLRSRLEGEIFRTMRGSRRFTSALLSNTIHRVMREAVRSGALMPGRAVTAATKADIILRTGNANFDGTLVGGYLLHILAPTQAQIDAREIDFTIYAVGSPAIHMVDGDILFTN